MSRAVPSSYSEYLYTNPTNMICDGGIMPLRSTSDPTSTNYRKCLRGEDKIFLREADHIRQKAFGNVGMLQPDNIVRASDMSYIQTQLGNYWNKDSFLFSATDPQIPMFVMTDETSLFSDLKQYFTLPTRQSASDTYTVLSESAVMNLFRDMKQLNYCHTAVSSAYTLCPYLWYQRVDGVSRRYDVHSEPYSEEPFSDSGYVWYDYSYTVFFRSGTIR